MFRLNFWPRAFLPQIPGHPDFKGMENLPYMQNPLASPALMVLASTAEATARGQAATQSNSPEGKDLTPFTTSYGMYHPGDPYTSPMYAPMAPFVHPNVDPRMRLLSPGAFRSMSQGDAEPYHSAFLPAKRPKLDSLPPVHSTTTTRYDTGTVRVKEERVPSPRTPGEEHTGSPGGTESTDRETPDEVRSLRKQRRRNNALDGGHTPCCPVCGITLRSGETEAHLMLEIERLDKINRSGRRPQSRDSTVQSRKTSSPGASRNVSISPHLEGSTNSRFETYLRVKAGRQGRLTAKNKLKRKKHSEETTCPVCSERVCGTPEELNSHVEVCLKNRSHGDDAMIDIEGEEEYEEYEWAGQTRIRATTLLQGGLAGSGFQAAKKASPEDDLDLNVDVDDSEQYGSGQYTEADIIPCSSDLPGEDKERRALRVAVLRNEGMLKIEAIPPERRRWSTDLNGETPEVTSSEAENDNRSSSFSSNEVINALKSKLHEQDQIIKKEITKPKCLICMGAKKLCPQCNMITSAADLRKIYL